MGGYGSGGHNRKKKLVESYPRIDSFNCENTILLGYLVTELIQAGIRTSRYFLCPKCGKRVRYLYLTSGADSGYKNTARVVCRQCLNVNYSSQSLPRDEQAVHAAVKALENIGIDISSMSPWAIMHIPDSVIKKQAKKTNHVQDYARYVKSRQKWYDSFPN